MSAQQQNLFACLPTDTRCEHFEVLLEAAGLRVERIVSWGQATPEGVWYDQEDSEWVVLLKGSAGLSIEGEAEMRVLKAGDWLSLPAHVRHRVEWTQAEGETLWLAIHHKNGLFPR
jgi:cupin 2 domain-containing protein